MCFPTPGWGGGDSKPCGHGGVACWHLVDPLRKQIMRFSVPCARESGLDLHVHMFLFPVVSRDNDDEMIDNERVGVCARVGGEGLGSAKRFVRDNGDRL